MKEIVELSNGDLYVTTIFDSIFDKRGGFMKGIDREQIVLLIDDRYFRAVYNKPYTSHQTFVIQDVRLFEPCKDLEDTKHCYSEQAIYVKIAYDDIIGYINVTVLELVEKQL